MVGCISGQVAKLDPVGAALDPGLNLARLVHLQIVDDQEDLPPGVLDQPPQEGDEAVGVQGAIVEHEPHQPAVADRRDHAPGDPLGEPRDRRGLAPGRVGAPDLVLVGDPGLVTPVDHPAHGLGPLGDRRVVPLQPGLDRRR